MKKIAICDDNELQRDLLNTMIDDFISETGQDFSVSLFSDCRELLRDVKTNGGYDLYLMDIIMPGINGMEVAATLRMMQDNGSIIFVTASLDYAFVSYEVQATYYAVKPLDRTMFFALLRRVFASSGEEKDARVLVKTRDGVKKLLLSDFYYVDLDNRALCYHVRGGATVLGQAIRAPFRESVIALLQDSRFAMCGVSMVINMSCVDQVDSESVLLRDGTLLYPSRNACADFKKTMKAYWKKKRTVFRRTDRGRRRERTSQRSDPIITPAKIRAFFCFSCYARSAAGQKEPDPGRDLAFPLAEAAVSYSASNVTVTLA